MDIEGAVKQVQDSEEGGLDAFEFIVKNFKDRVFTVCYRMIDNSEDARVLHKKAYEWYKNNNLIIEAIDHAFSAEEMDTAASLIDEHGEFLWIQGEHTTLGRWLTLLPDEYIFSHIRFRLSE